MITNDIYIALTQNEALNSAVGGRVYPATFPQLPKYPAIVYNRVSQIPFTNLNGYSSIDAGRYQIDIFSLNYNEINTISSLIKEAMNGKGTEVNIQDGYDADTNLFRKTMDYTLFENVIQ